MEILEIVYCDLMCKRKIFLSMLMALTCLQEADVLESINVKCHVCTL